jgi:group I intron endonuclease
MDTFQFTVKAKGVPRNRRDCDLLKKTGVYAIRQVSSGKVYIGSASRSFSHRWRRHKNELREGVHHSTILQRTWNKYGEFDFVWEILELCNPDDCITREQHWIDVTDSCDPSKGFNLAKIAGSKRGLKCSPEACRNMGQAYYTSEKRQQHLRKLIEMNRGKKRTPETCKKISQANMGRKNSPEVIEKMRNDPRRKVLSESHRAAVVAANKRRLADPEFLKKFNEARRLKGYKGNPTGPKSFITANGQTRTVSAWAEDLGISPGSIWQRIRSGLTPEQAVTRPKMPGVAFSESDRRERARKAAKERFLSGKSLHQRCITHNGETLLIVEWAERLGVQGQSIIKRLKEGMTEEQALTKPFVRRSPRGTRKELTPAKLRQG